MSVDQFGIHLGSLYLRFYGVLLVTGAFLAGYVTSLEARRRGHNPEAVWDGFLWVVLSGIIGARIWHILTPPPSMVAAGRDTLYYLNLMHLEPVNFFGFQVHIPAALAVPNGGLGIVGAVIGGAIGLYLFTWRRGFDFAGWADMVAPGLALAQAVGRWGNYVNQELYGQPTTLPWGIITNPADGSRVMLGLTDPNLRFHPLFLYESIGNLLICLASLYIGRRYASRLGRGDIFLLYLLMYPALRFLLEFIRLDSPQVLGLNANQTLMFCVAAVAALIIATRHRRRRRHYRRVGASA